MSPAVTTSTLGVGLPRPAVMPVGMPLTYPALPSRFADSGNPAPLSAQVFSDLHLDVNRTAPPHLAPGTDVVVIAGDTCEGCVGGFAALRATMPEVPIIVVAGNHEHYGRRSLPDEFAEARRHAADHGIVFLEDSTAVIQGVRFVGATLWTDYALDGAARQSAAMRTARDTMADHRCIAMSRQPWLRFRPEDAQAMHVASRAFIDAALAVPFAGPTVVVTHHAPHPDSIATRYRGDSLNPAYVSDLSATITAGQPALWVHGHVHSSFDYMIGATRIICNPGGYGGENPFFDPALIVEVPR